MIRKTAALGLLLLIILQLVLLADGMTRLKKNGYLFWNQDMARCQLIQLTKGIHLIRVRQALTEFIFIIVTLQITLTILHQEYLLLG